MNKKAVKEILGDLPLTAEFFWYLRQTGKPPVGGYALDKLQKIIPDWVAHAQAAQQPPTGKKILIFTMLRYWLEQTTMMGLALSSLGHDVTLTYLPYRHWKYQVSRFDLRRQNLYMQKVLKPLKVQLNMVACSCSMGQWFSACFLIAFASSFWFHGTMGILCSVTALGSRVGALSPLCMATTPLPMAMLS